MDQLAFDKRRSEWVLETSKSLTTIMNCVHSVSFSEAFWARLLMPYVWSVYNQQEFYGKKDFKSPVLLENINGWQPPTYRQIIFDMILATGRSLKSKDLLSRLDALVEPRKALVVGVRSEIIAKEFNAQKVNINWIPFLRKKNKSARKKLLDHADKEEATVRKNLIKNIPKVYVEYFCNILYYVSKLKHKNIDNVYFEHLPSFAERLVVAYLAECGATVKHLQTGGAIGEVEAVNLEHKRYQYDSHLTYGWKLHEKDVPFYAVRLEEFSRYYKEAGGVGNEIDLLLVYNGIVNKNTIRDHYDDCTRSFSEGIDRRKYPNIVLRPRGLSRKFSSKKSLFFLKKYFSEIDSGKTSMAKLCSRSKVVIHWSYPTTNFLECVFVNHPVLCLLSNENEEDLTHLAKKYVVHMERLKIFHRNVRSIIDHLNTTNIDSWWKVTQEDQWYKSFKETFARSKASYEAEKG